MKRTLKSIQSKYGILSEQGTTDSRFFQMYKKKFPNSKNTSSEATLKRFLDNTARNKFNKMVQAGQMPSGNTTNGSATYKLDGKTYEMTFNQQNYYPAKFISKGDNKDLISFIKYQAKAHVMDNM